jgi:hypothetical protein
VATIYYPPDSKGGQHFGEPQVKKVVAGLEAKLQEEATSN